MIENIYSIYIYIIVGGAQKLYDILCVPAMAVHLAMHPQLHFVWPHSVQVALSQAEASSAVQYLAEIRGCPTLPLESGGGFEHL